MYQTKNKILVLVVVCLALFSLLSLSIIFSNQNNEDIEESPISANYMVYNDIEELENAVDLVVKVKSTGNSKNIEPEAPKENDLKAPNSFGYTVTDVEVLEVIKNKQNNPISINSTLQIVEPTFISEYESRKIRHSWEDYTSLENSKKYLLFLVWSDEKDAYEIHGLHQGKMNIDGKDTKEQEKENHNENYKALKEQAIKKYMK